MSADKNICRHIDTKEKAEMFGLFLSKEKRRHIDDIIKIVKDIGTIERIWGIRIPEVEEDFYVEVDP